MLEYGVLFAIIRKVKEELLDHINSLFASIRLPKDGLNGKDGLPGKDGERGPQGSRGPQGEQGPRGEKGDPGNDGLPGAHGDTGPAGPQGEQGLPGKDGERGPQGDRGEQGQIGTQGPQGEQGPKGDKGEQGLPGKDGERGPQGEQGLPGPKGEPGLQGPKGDQGLKGEQGDQGPPGEQGLPGPQGPKGDPGEDAKLPDIEPIVTKIREEYQKLQSALTAKVNMNLMSMAGSSGGGSANILDNDDVEYKRLADVTENAILIFDSTKKKFVVRDLLEFIQGIQAGVEVQYNKLIDVDGVYTYIGEAVPGTAQTASVWRIKRVEQNGADINILWSNGTASFDKTWTDRLTYTYS